MGSVAVLELYLGGARSGKSGLVERRICESVSYVQRIYIATATAGDEEITARIAHHQHQLRDDGWQTLEVSEELVAASRSHAGTDP
jgi:adenosylcobinamide kinase/adenosylcobinamide-phosphate guanylyltransferase